MDLTLVTDQWNPRGGGRERYLAELATWALSHGDRVHVHCLQDRSQSTPPKPTSISAVGRRGPAAERRLDAAVRRIRTAFPDRPMLTARPQIGATHYQLHSGVYHDAFAAERESLDSAVRRLLFWPALRLNRHRVAQLDAEGRLFDPTSTTQFMTFTAAGAERLRAGFSVAAHRIRISHPGVDLARFRALSGNEQPASPGAGLLLLFVGHDFVLKGLKTAIGATARCRQHGIDASLMVAGAGPTRRFRRVATDEGVGNHVFFLGAVDQDALAALYRRSHVLIHPTYYDPFARVVVEAFASGCVVVTTHRCGASEVMNDGVHGRLVERPDDAAAFAAACCSYSGPVAWRETREAGLALANTLSFEAHARSVRNWLAH